MATPGTQQNRDDLRAQLMVVFGPDLGKNVIYQSAAFGVTAVGSDELLVPGSEAVVRTPADIAMGMAGSRVFLTLSLASVVMALDLSGVEAPATRAQLQGVVAAGTEWENALNRAIAAGRI